MEMLSKNRAAKFFILLSAFASLKLQKNTTKIINIRTRANESPSCVVMKVQSASRKLPSLREPPDPGPIVLPEIKYVEVSRGKVVPYEFPPLTGLGARPRYRTDGD